MNQLEQQAGIGHLKVVIQQHLLINFLQEFSYSEAGTYDVSLEVTNQAGDDLLVKSDYITVLPLSESPIGENVIVCQNLTIPPLEVEGENVLWYGRS